LKTEILKSRLIDCGMDRWIAGAAYEADAGQGQSGFFVRFDDLPESKKSSALVRELGDDAVITDKGFFFRVR
jgi:hypothetical protein